jgi:outer membrane murein-binding lipoprotein Lpp
MSLASPNAVVKVYYPDFSVQELLGLRFNRLSAAQESTGYRSVSYAGNMSTYIFFGVVGAVGLVLLVVLFLGCKSRIKKFIKGKLDKIKKKMNSLNAQIAAIHLVYLESVLSF